MATAPEPYHYACLEVLRHAIVQVRARANMKYPHAQLAALMDAVHNIPGELAAWGPESDGGVREWLVFHDRRWAAQTLALADVYERALREGRNSRP